MQMLAELNDRHTSESAFPYPYIMYALLVSNKISNIYFLLGFLDFWILGFCHLTVLIKVTTLQRSPLLFNKLAKGFLFLIAAISSRLYFPSKDPDWSCNIPTNRILLEALKNSELMKLFKTDVPEFRL